MKTYKIYKLIDPRDNSIKYVGVTTRTLQQRLSQHWYESKNFIGTYKRHWIKELYNLGFKPNIKLIEICNKDNWEEREIYWISYFENLTNCSLGGKGIIFKNRNSIERSSNSHKRKILQFSTDLILLKEFDSIKEAHHLLNISRTNIGNVLKGRALTAGGFHFIYKDLYNENYTIDLTSSNGPKIKNKIQIEYLSGQLKIFNSQMEVATELKVNSSFISMLLKNNREIGKKGKLSHVKNITNIKI